MTHARRMVRDDQLDALMQREVALYEARTPRSKAVFEDARTCLLNGVPMPWMGDWGTAYPLFYDRAAGNRIVDVDGNEYVDFCLGDTGAMFGHSPEATAAAVTAQVRRGITTIETRHRAFAMKVQPAIFDPAERVVTTSTRTCGFPQSKLLLVTPTFLNEVDVSTLVELDGCGH